MVSAPLTPAAILPPRCPRCHGLLFNESGDSVCLMCGWRESHEIQASRGHRQKPEAPLTEVEWPQSWQRPSPCHAMQERLSAAVHEARHD